jgi:hypothetical protein
MAEPSVEADGWELDDGESRHAEAPATFEIPSLRARKGLQPGDYAKLVFRILVDGDEEPVSVERMWVIVRERRESGYYGILDNEPDGIAENDDLWVGTELPFGPRHIIDIQRGDAQSAALAAAAPRRAWPRD